jgi:hypothetical protein
LERLSGIKIDPKRVGKKDKRLKCFLNVNIISNTKQKYTTRKSIVVYSMYYRIMQRWVLC